MTRIVSLIASSTEIICALGYENHLVGRSHECDYPLSVRRLPVCTEPKFPLSGTSYDIDQRVKAILQEGLSVYRVFADRLNDLRPDIIFTQTQCEVCAVSLKDVEAAVCSLVASQPEIVSLHPNNLEDIWHDIQKVADNLQNPERGRQLCDRLQARMNRIHRQASAAEQKPAVACIEWLNPLMASGNWIPELVQMAGGINVFGKAGTHAPQMTFSQLVKKNPDIIIIMPCGFNIRQSREEMPALSSQPGWNELSAVRSQRVFIVDGNQYFNRPGPRLVESLEILAEIIHPELFQLGHQSKITRYP